MRQHLDADQSLRLLLLGDVDLAVAEILSTRLAELKTAGRPVRLDLSQLAFIDSSGVQALLVALTDPGWTGWQLEVVQRSAPASTKQRKPWGSPKSYRRRTQIRTGGSEQPRARPAPHERDAGRSDSAGDVSHQIDELRACFPEPRMGDLTLAQTIQSDFADRISVEVARRHPDVEPSDGGCRQALMP
jgi:STAS domain